jgi:short-subunit dehydrogenase
MPAGGNVHAMTDALASDRAPIALVTGASSGIGLELAREFVAHGHDVIAAAEDADIARVPAELASDGSGAVMPLPIDLATRQGVDQLLQGVRGVGAPAGVAAINAGVGASGEVP